MSTVGTVAIVTGGAGCFGRTFTEALLKSGVKVCMCDVNQEDGEKALSEVRAANPEASAIFTICDVSKDAHWEDVFKKCTEELGPPDVLINNAGMGDEQDFMKTTEINLGGTCRGTLKAFNLMNKASGGKGGTVVNIASIAGVKTVPFGPIYAATKHGIVGLSRALGHEFHYSYSGVRVLCYCPSLTDSPFLVHSMQKPFCPQVSAAIKNMYGKFPLLTLDEVGNGFMMLLQEGKTGSVMVMEKGKDPYFVQPSVV